MDFASLPPEINSGRMYFGAGAAPLLGAAAAWDTLAGELRSASAAYSSVIADVTAVWLGPSSEEMARTAASYSAWIDLTAANAERAAEQAKAAASAFDTAFAATVPPPIVAANRAQLAFLVATNLLGQNTPAIAATEIQYAAMWAQDAAAMDNYAVSSATAAQMTAFAPPAPATNSVDGREQGAPPGPAASTLPPSMSTMSSSLGNMTAPAATAADQAADPLAVIGALFGPTSPASVLTPAIGGYLVGTEPYGLASVGSSVAGLYQKLQALPSAGGPGIPQSATISGVSTVGSPASVSLGVGRAGVVGRLSVPPGWATAAPEMKLAASVGPQVGLAGAPNAIAADLPGNAYGSVALQGAASRAAAGADGFGRTARGGVQPWQSTATIIVIPDDE